MTKEEYTKERPLKVFTAFSGYDSQCMALDRLGVPYVLIGWSEIDKYAIQAHNAIYPQWADRNAGDISKIDWGGQPDFDLFTYSFPCTDISNAGKQQGLSEDSGTRSSLLWECRKAIEIKRPKYLLMENVKALVSKKFMPDFRRWEQWLAGWGYCNFYKVLNAKDYGVPQNRERVFMVSILDEGASFHFPEPFPLDRRLKDILEEDVDERYYLSDRIVKGFMEHNCKHYEKGSGDTGVIQIGNILKEKGFSNPQRGRIYSADGISPTINTMAGGGLEPKIIQKERGKNNGGESTSFRIRKLTPREVFRLMDVNEEDIDRIQAAGISRSQQYKMAGNSIVVSCLYHIFRKMFIDTGFEGMHKTLF